jgi:hypothetical protein
MNRARNGPTPHKLHIRGDRSNHRLRPWGLYRENGPSSLSTHKKPPKKHYGDGKFDQRATDERVGAGSAFAKGSGTVSFMAGPADILSTHAGVAITT